MSFVTREMRGGICLLRLDHGKPNSISEAVSAELIAKLDEAEKTADTVVLRWTTFDEASDQAGISRRYGGIHFQDADLRGREIGHEVGRRAFAQARAYWDPPAT